jgi:ADP-ribosylglycohydrolase
MIGRVAEGESLREVIADQGCAWASAGRLSRWSALPDRKIIGAKLTPACYLPESFTAALALAWKYHNDFDAGIRANAQCGGDNCHRGAVVGALLGAANPIAPRWLEGLADARVAGESQVSA